ncbi:MAG: chitobiase/beta-hexosaminidase C-terminal domain-containing protein [Clostridia bacterium]|nr:chitobiase/beta-hexosaminidase C-terminal domain-containing protein [Clostridia bacterium]
MKKLISIFLSLIIILGCFGFTVSADEETPIVIVPGFMGSKLYADSDFDDRVFGENGDVNEFSKIAAKRLFVKEPVNLQKAAEYGAGNKYKALASVLCDTYPKRKVYFFSYDFTKNAQSGAVLLNEFLKTQPKVILVCHSYGGLVVASYLNAYGSSKVEKTICIGVPFEGTVYAQLATDMGFINGSSVSQLMPTDNYLKEVYGKDYVKNWVSDQNFLYSDGIPVISKTDNVYYIMGGGMLTASQLLYEDGKIIDILFDNDGDSTVTKLSSTMMGKFSRNQGDNVAVFNVRHSEMLQSEDVANYILSVLEGKNKHTNTSSAKGYDVVKAVGDVKVKLSGETGNIESTSVYVENNYGVSIRPDERSTIVAVTGEDNYIVLTGNSDGFVDLYVKRYDENNKLVYTNTFIQIPVTKNTVVKSIITNGDMWLYTDFDNDGVFDDCIKSEKDGQKLLVTDTPVASATGGKYRRYVNVKLDTATNGGRIYYTLDGSDPLTNGKLYMGELKIDQSCKLTAVTIKDKYTSGPVLTEEYIIKQPNKLFLFVVAGIILLLAVIILIVRLYNNRKRRKYVFM